MSTQTHRKSLMPRAVASLAFVATFMSSAMALADDGPQLQRPHHVARSVNGVASAPANPAPPPADTVATDEGGAVAHPADASLAGVAEPPAEDDAPRSWKHSGFVLDGKVGMLGCLRTICSGASGHAADPGVRVGGFLGGNIGGVLEIGVQGGWGRLRPGVGPDRNVLDLYGVDTAGLQQQIDQQTGGMAQQLGLDELDLGQLAVRDAALSSVQAGVGLRLHFVPRGRFDAWVGSGVGYELFRADYRTTAGDVRVDFHGLGVPAQGGLSVFLTRRLAIGADFEYRWTHFGVGNLQVPGHGVAVPMSVLADQGFGAAQIGGKLPRFWTAGLTARVRV